MVTPYEVQIKTARGWTSAGTYCDRHKAYAQFVSHVARAEDEGRIEDWRLIERRGRGETVLAISTYEPEPSTVVRERALEDARRCPDKARMRSRARSMVVGPPCVRTELRKAERNLRAAQLEFARKPDATHAALLWAASDRLTQIYADISVRVLAGEQVMV